MNPATRKEILRLSFATQEGHLAAAFSVLDILNVLYDEVMAYSSANPAWQERDRLILSKGHAAIALYSVLAGKGFFPVQELQTFCEPGSRLEGHPNLAIPGVEVSTGSLGHGLPMAVGIAMALKLKGSKSRVFCIVGDAECCEGSIWEAIILAGHYKLSNLYLILDSNRSSPVPFSFADKIICFGWSPRNVSGHNKAEMIHAFRPADFEAPTAIIAHTVKGKGCQVMEDNPEMWHHRSPATPEELDAMLAMCE